MAVDATLIAGVTEVGLKRLYDAAAKRRKVGAPEQWKSGVHEGDPE
jgi:hypothetical protein